MPVQLKYQCAPDEERPKSSIQYEDKVYCPNDYFK